nr:ATP-binding protein [Glycomyces xiaoerkulensis]
MLVNGARQCGKSTLVAQLGSERDAEMRSLDNAYARQAAGDQPADFVLSDKLLIIDEVQRDPELLLSIKETVDADPRPGRFLLTGSARILGLRTLPDTLVGRMETIELWPLSQGEIDGAPDGFVDAIFHHGPQLKHRSEEDRKGYVERVARGGYPDALVREGKRRTRFLRSYVSDLINRDVIQLAAISQADEMRALVTMLADRSGQLIVPANIAADLDISRWTVGRYLALLREVFLIKRIPAWRKRVGSRAVSTAKTAFVDSGVATSLLNLDTKALSEVGGPLGPLLEGFVMMEIARQLTWCEQEVEMYHYRTRDKVEVDIVLENARGQVVALEIKAGSTVRGDDFRGLRHLEERLGEKFLVGAVLHTSQETMSFGPKMRAIPIAAIWETPSPKE